MREPVPELHYTPTPVHVACKEGDFESEGQKLRKQMPVALEAPRSDALVSRIGNRVTFWPKGGERLSGSVDFAQDVFALGLPHVASRIFIAYRQERDDRVGEFSGRSKALLADELGQVAKEALDQIHPG